MPSVQEPRLDPDERIRFHAGAETADEICLVGGPDHLPVFEPYNRIYSYKPGREPPWLYLDVESYVCDVVSERFEAGGPEFFALASEDGEIWVLSAPGTGFSEIIPGAGEFHEASRYGAIYSLRWIDDTLIAAGEVCQIHRRVGRHGPWELISRNMLGDRFTIIGIAGRTNDLYVLRVPQTNNPDYDQAAHRGQILHSAGGDLRIVWVGPEAVTGEPVLLANGDVAVGGPGGTIIAGNHRSGFSVVARGDPRQPGIAALADVGGDLFAADGLLLHCQGARTDVVRTGLRPDQESSIYLSVRSDRLLSVGYHDILRRIAVRWERVHFPGNPPVTSDTDWSRW